MKFLLGVFTGFFFTLNGKIILNVPKNLSKAPHIFLSSAFLKKYEPFVDKSAKVLVAEIVAPTPDRMFVEIRYKPLCRETYMARQIISPPIKLFNLAAIYLFASKEATKFLPDMGATMTFFARIDL